MTLPSFNLHITVATLAERPILANLLQLYIHDFSEYWSGTPQGELEDDGRFFDYDLDRYWSDARCVPLLIRREGKPAGFALLDGAGHTQWPVDWNMAEFFVVRKHRRAGVGRAAAHEIFSRHPGGWEVAVARHNVRALSFWRGTIASCPAVFDLEAHDLATRAWDGALFRFRITAGPG